MRILVTTQSVADVADADEADEVVEDIELATRVDLQRLANEHEVDGDAVQRTYVGTTWVELPT